MSNRQRAPSYRSAALGEGAGVETGHADTNAPSVAKLAKHMPGNGVSILMRRTIRRPQLRQLVPLSDTTIYELEEKGEFPRRFYLTSRCVVWDLAEVDAWIAQRRAASDAAMIKRAPSPDVRLRKSRPVKPQTSD